MTNKFPQRTAVVLLNWNGEKFLEKFLPSIIENTPKEQARIIVADNGSTDNSIKFLKENYSEIELVLLDKNYGFAGGYNKALKKIDAEYFILLNTDIEVIANWLEPLIKLLDENKNIAACMPKIRAYHAKEQFEYAGASGGFIDKWGYPFCRGRILDDVEIDKGQYDDVISIFWATGACLVIRADVFKAVGGFDEDFFAHMEEIDLCWRLKNLGYEIATNPKSVVYHVGGGTLPKTSPRKLYLNYRNNLLMMYKNLPSKKLFSHLFVRMILDGISAFIYLLKFQFSSFKAVFNSHIDFYKNIRKFKIKRKELQKKYIKYNHPEIYNKSIIWKNIVSKVKKFSLLDFKTKILK